MKIALRGGHSQRQPGAIGFVNEHEEMQKLYQEVERLLVSTGHTIVDCNTKSFSRYGDLTQGVHKANKAHKEGRVDLFLSLHMNSDRDKSDTTGYGVECWTFNSKSVSNRFAIKIENSISNLGFRSRGVKYKGYYETRATLMPSIILETCFCNNQSDVDQFKRVGYTAIASAIVVAINSVDKLFNV